MTNSEKRCLSKIQHKTAECALSAAFKFVKKGGDRCYPYKCPECKLFHLTSKKQKILVKKIAVPKKFVYKKGKIELLHKTKYVQVTNWKNIKGDLEEPIGKILHR